MRALGLALLLALLLGLQPVSPAPAGAAAAAGPLPSAAQWQADVRAVYAKKRPGAYLTERAASGQKRLAIVLDIDNTSLATHYSWPQPIKRTLKLTRKAQSRGMSVVFVTGRFEDSLANVTKALDAAGYHHDGICGRRHGEALADGKQRCRAQYADQGLTFVLNVGNRSTDFVGGDYERRLKLPSYGGALS
ncbi:HAD family acid phosphatase [Nocardioides nitrophenolicus]|uniref:HAD family acid phosphatase n=1 Tax=Nocardioides nitrophenolicus TaxID=60489 RepID=UPI0019566B06|nr:HAD family acid phosphatase [Nocardioides nitrophenolicus]MBM7517262.1 putative secreted acid phosphatase [Nocardioides nitrophenolicus]